MQRKPVQTRSLDRFGLSPRDQTRPLAPSWKTQTLVWCKWSIDRTIEQHNRLRMHVGTRANQQWVQHWTRFRLHSFREQRPEKKKMFPHPILRRCQKGISKVIDRFWHPASASSAGCARASCVCFWLAAASAARAASRGDRRSRPRPLPANTAIRTPLCFYFLVFPFLKMRDPLFLVIETFQTLTAGMTMYEYFLLLFRSSSSNEKRELGKHYILIYNIYRYFKFFFTYSQRLNAKKENQVGLNVGQNGGFFPPSPQ